MIFTRRTAPLTIWNIPLIWVGLGRTVPCGDFLTVNVPAKMSTWLGRVCRKIPLAFTKGVQSLVGLGGGQF